MRPHSSKLAFRFSSFCASLLTFVISPLLVLPGCNPAQPAGGAAGGGKKQASQSLTPNQAEKAKELLGGSGSKGLTKIKLLLNWYPEAEHGGFYAAKADGIYEKYGLDVEIVPGGKSTVVGSRSRSVRRRQRRRCPHREKSRYRPRGSHGTNSGRPALHSDAERLRH